MQRPPARRLVLLDRSFFQEYGTSRMTISWKLVFSLVGATRFGGFFDGGSPIGFFGVLGSLTGDFLCDGGSFLSAGGFVFLVRICLDPHCFADRPRSTFIF